ncbi:ATP-binding cassette sub-family A member 10 [Manis javanica]|nr:ATP-binding cassette sub-family A member 10 [Manis javanica]
MKKSLLPLHLDYYPSGVIFPDPSGESCTMIIAFFILAFDALLYLLPLYVDQVLPDLNVYVQHPFITLPGNPSLILCMILIPSFMRIAFLTFLVERIRENLILQELGKPSKPRRAGRCSSEGVKTDALAAASWLSCASHRAP